MATSKPMSNLQLELLKMYAFDISDEALKEVQMLLARHFAEKATSAMDRVWEEKGLTAQDMVNWTHEHSRLKTRS
jgi:hypothetical protein